MDRTTSSHEQAKDRTNNGPHRLFAPTRRTIHQVRTKLLEPDLPKVKPPFPFPDLSNQPRDCYQIIGEDEAPLGDAIPTNLEPQIH
jgi:hypothetical protein